MKKKLLVFLVALLALVTFTGCGSNSTEGNNGGKEEANSKGKCQILDCINVISVNATYEEANEAIGFEGELEREGDGWKTYKWELNDDENVEITFYSTSCSIKINFPDKKIQNSKVDFSRYSEISSAMNKGENVSYEVMKEKFGGVEGTLIEKSSGSLKYEWVNAQGGYINANFNEAKTRCSFIFGRV